MSRIIYLYIRGGFNYVIPNEASKFYQFLLSDIKENYFTEHELCINHRYEDMTDFYWITAPESYMVENYPELLPSCNEIPRFSEFLDWKPENFGYHTLSPKYVEIDEIDLCT